MLTKTKELPKKKTNDLEINHGFYIPEKIQNTINERGFYMYEWIGANDVKASIQRDFLKYIKRFGTLVAALFLIPGAILFFAEDKSIFFTFIFLFLLGINLLFAFILGILAIKRSNILRKNAYVLLTDSSISINGKIEKLKENKINDDNQVKKITNLFEEEIFKESNIEKTKKGFFKQVLESLGQGYSFIFRMGKGNNKNSGQIVLILLALYTVYSLSLGIIYFVGIFFIWILGIIITIINKQILLISGHKITSINNNFEDIDDYSKKLIIEKNNLSNLLKNAMNNEWKDGLLNKINKGLEKINKYADNSINTNISLKKEIKNSKYKEMFNFSIYNSWIKKQIHTPLEEILQLLNKNLETLKQNKINIEKQIEKTSDISLKGPLIASKTRTKMRIEEIEKHNKMIKIYIDKL